MKRALSIGTVALATLALTAPYAGIGYADGKTVASPARTTHDFDGRVGAINRSARTFQLTRRGRSTVRIRVVSSTRYEHLRGFSSLRRGMRVDVDARHSSKGWTATKIERERDHDQDD